PAWPPADCGVRRDDCGAQVSGREFRTKLACPPVETVLGHAKVTPRFVDNDRWPCQRITPPEGRRLPAPRRAPGILLKVDPTRASPLPGSPRATRREV